MLIECDVIFNNWYEILICEVVIYYFYFLKIVDLILFIDDLVNILLFIGRDFLRVYYVFD